MKRIVLIVFNCLLCAYLALAVTVFSKSDTEARACTGLQIKLEESVVEGTLTAEGVKRMVIDDHLYPVGSPLQDINLRQMEETLQARELIEKAECYTTQDGTLHIDVRQLMPVLRVKADDGDDYYIDANGHMIPPGEYTCNLPVATGSISHSFAQRVLAPVGSIVMADDFWRNQVEQLTVLPDSTLEMIPRVGSHTVYFGQPTDITNKLERLRKFYLYGLSVVGWNKYDRISVELSNQIICKRVK